MKKPILSLLFSLIVVLSFSQSTTITSGPWSDAGTWTGGVPNAGADIIITSGNAVTIDVSIDLNSLTIESGASLTVADGTGPFSMNVSGDIVNLGTIDLQEGTGVVNTTLDNTSTIVFSGGGNSTFNELSFDGANVIVSTAFTVVDNFTIGATTADIEVTASNQDLIFLGDFIIQNNGRFETTASTTNFDALGNQLIDVANGLASFQNIDLEGNGSIKTINGNLTTIGGTLEIFAGSVLQDQSAGNTHTLYNVEVNNQNALDLSGSTIQLMGGEIRFGANATEDGTIDFGFGVGEGAEDPSNNVDLILMAGNTFVENDDILAIDGDITVKGTAQLFINGPSGNLPEQDAQIIAGETHQLVIEQNGDIYLRGQDNFPTSFGTYSFEPNSIVRYDVGIDQTVRGLDDGGDPLLMARLILSDDGTTKTLAAGETLNLSGQFNINEGTIFTTGSEVDLTIGGSIFTSGANADFIANSATVRLNGSVNQTLDRFEGSGSYSVRKMIISNPSNSQRTVNIDSDIVLNSTGTSVAQQSLFEVNNDGGNDANILIVDLDDNTILGSNNSTRADVLEVGPFTNIFTSGTEFALDFNTSGSADVSNLDANSTVRFDSGTEQTIPNISGSYGNIEFNGNGNKYVPLGSELVILGDVTRAGGGFILNLDQTRLSGFVLPVSNFNISVGGDWNMTEASVETNGGNSTVLFNGTDQIISASDFENVSFTNTGAKTVQGRLNIRGNLEISGTNVSVQTNSDINMSAGDWTEQTSASFSQDGGTTTFTGGTQAITANGASYFFDLDIENNAEVSIVSDSVRAFRDFDFLNGSTLNLASNAIRIGRRALFDNGSTLNYSDVSAAIILDGDVAQDFDNEVSSAYPTLRFSGVGEKDLTDQDFNIAGDFIVESGTSVNGNGERINFSGDNWTINGSFNHGNTVDFQGAAVSVSASDFNDIEVSNGSTVTLTGNINLEDDLTIEDGGLLNANSFSIQLEDDWNNYGTFTPGTGTVTFTGNQSQIRTLRTAGDATAENQETAKAFYNLIINNAPGQDVVFEDDEMQDGQTTILNDLTVESGNIRFQEDAGGTFATHTVNVGGSLAFIDGVLEYQTSDITTFELNDGATSATNNIDLGGNSIGSIVISGTETYQLGSTFTMIDRNQSVFTLNSGVLDFNGQIMFLERGGMNMTGGQLIVDEGATFVLDNSATFTKSGGDMSLVGLVGNPATLTNSGAGNYTFLQTGGDLNTNNYVIANTSGNGLDIQGGTIQGFADGLFTNGSGTAYLTIESGVDIGTISAGNVVFNEGPTYSVNVDINEDGSNVPNSGTLTFVIAGGTLSGAQNENDVPENGAADGFILWQDEDGFVWNGATSSDWETASNWSITGAGVDGNSNGYPDENDDVVFINAGLPNYPVLDETRNIGRITLSGGAITLDGGNLDVDGNFTIFSAATVTVTNSESLNISGSLANAGNLIQNTGSITFDGVDGSHSIDSNDDLVNLIIDAGSEASYGLGSALTVVNSFQLLGGNFDASSGFTLNIEGDWSVAGGTFLPGVGTVNFSGASGNQSISGGTINNANFTGAATKTLVGNISVAGDVNLQSGSGQLISNANSEVLFFVGDDWNNNNGTTAFLANDGSVIFNGQGGQNLQGSFSSTFNRLIFQGTGNKDINVAISIATEISMAGPVVEINPGVTVTGIGSAILNMSSGVLDIEDVDNFPSLFSAYNLDGGTVRYITNTTPQTIRGGISYNNLEMRANGNNDVASKVLGGDITINGIINISNGDITFDAGTNTIQLLANNAANNNHLQLGNDDQLIWTADGGGTLIHSSNNEWDIDADLAGTNFENVVFSGGRKDLAAAIAINGDFTINAGVNFDQNANLVTNDGGADGDVFTLSSSATYENNVVDNGAIDGLNGSLPSGFDLYEISALSTIDLDADGDIEIITTDLNGSIAYGNILLFNNGNATLDGNLLVSGDFDMNANPTLLDNGNNLTLNGSFVDLQNYIPSGVVTFAGVDQNITDGEGGTADNLLFGDVVFAGSGTKTLNPNDANNEVIEITSSLIINSGVSVTTNRSMLFSGSSWSNAGNLSITNAGRPLILDGNTATWDIGENAIGALTLRNNANVTFNSTGLNIENGDVFVSDGCVLNFGENTNHTIASDDFFLNSTGQLVFGSVGNESTITFDRLGNQRLPVINETTSAQITGVPNIVLEGTGQKLLTGAVLVNDVTIGSSIGSFDIDVNNEYAIEVRGSWDNQGAPFVEREGQVLFFATNSDAKFINPGGDVFAEVSFDGSADRLYSLQGDLLIEGEGPNKDYDLDGREDGLTITRGTLDLAGNVLILGNNDQDDPSPEYNEIAINGRLIVDAGAILEFDTQDDNNNTGEENSLVVFGRLDLDGDQGNPATTTRSAGNARYLISIESGGTIEADNYSLNFLSDLGFVVKDGALLAREDNSATANSTFTNGSFSGMATNAGPNTYLVIESDLSSDIQIRNVSFNFDGVPTVGNHFNVERSNDVGNNVITFSETSGSLGNNGGLYENDPDGDPGRLVWPAPTTTIWEGSVSTDWFDASNWLSGLPDENTEAVIAQGNPYNPILNLDGSAANLYEIEALSVTNGFLRIRNPEGDDVFRIQNAFTLGDGTAGVMIVESSDIEISVQGSVTVSNNATFDSGGSTLLLEATALELPVFDFGDQSLGNLRITGLADYQFTGQELNIDGDFVAEAGASFLANNGGYEFTVGGDLLFDPTVSFSSIANGDFIFNGTAGTQTIENLTAAGMIFRGAATKSVSNITVSNEFEIEEGASVQGVGPITWSNDVTISGQFNGASGIEYEFAGDDWIAGANSYGNELGTVIFTRPNGNQHIRQSSADPVEFHSLTLRGSTNVLLGRLINAIQEDGNVDMTGDLTIENTIDELRLSSYQITANGSGTQTLTLQAGERIEITGSNNFPSDFSIYALDPTSTVSYQGSVDQVITGGFSYGNLNIENGRTNTLANDIDVVGNLVIQDNSILDVTANNYLVRLAGRYDTEDGTTDGQFIARDGTFIMDGSEDQIMQIGNTGTQTFNRLQIDKAGGVVDLQNTDYFVSKSLFIEDGVLDVNSLDLTIGGDLDISGTGGITSGGDGTLILTSSSNQTIRANSSSFPGNVIINGENGQYQLIDNFSIENVLTIDAGTLDLNGNRLEVGNAEDVINISGTLNVSTATSPGGTLALGDQTQLVVQAGGAINIVGSGGQIGTVTRRSTGSYGFTVGGNSSSSGVVSARNYLFEHMNINGINISENGLIDESNNFSDGTFSNGLAGGIYLRIENEQNFLEADGRQIANVVFATNPGGGAVNVAKSVSSAGVIEFENYIGEFSGEDFDSDPGNLIVWLDPTEIIWTGVVSSDWYNPNNWSTLTVPVASDNVVIPSSPIQATLFPPVINNDLFGSKVAKAELQDLVIENGNSLTVSTSDAQGDLKIGGSLTLEDGASFRSQGALDSISIGGNLILEGNPSFNPGDGSTFTFNAEEGIVNLGVISAFNNLVIDVDGALTLDAPLTVDGDFLMTDTSGVFNSQNFDLIVRGDFQNLNPNPNAILVGLGSVELLPEVGGVISVDPGNVAYYDLQLGDGSTANTFVLNDLLTVQNNMTVAASSTLDVNGNNVSIGDDLADLEVFSLDGNMTISGGVSLALGNGTELSINSGSNFQLSGSSGNNAQIIRNGGIGSYLINVTSGAEFGAEFFDISNIGGAGVNFIAGSTVTVNSSGVEDVDTSVGDGNDNLILRNGSFSNGLGTAYLTLGNAFASTLKADNVSFNANSANPSLFNVVRNGSLDDIIFVDPSGTLQGPSAESDDQNTGGLEASTGNVQWFYNNPLFTWTGAVDTDYANAANWLDVSGLVPPSAPNSANTVIIPDVSTGSGNNPIVSTGGQSAADLTIEAGGSLSVNSGITFIVVEDLTNTGEIVLDGSLEVQGRFNNDGQLVPGALSTVTINFAEDVVFNGGSSFNNLIIDADSDDRVITTTASLDVNGNLEIVQGQFVLADPSHVLSLAGDLSITGTAVADAGVDAIFDASIGVLVLDGTVPQSLSNSDNTTSLNVAELTLEGGTVKTFNIPFTVEGDLEVNGTGTSLATGASSTSTLLGDLALNSGTFAAGASSTVVFEGAGTQRITATGSTSEINFQNLQINNQNVGNVDLQLALDVVVDGNLEFTNGVIAADGSNLVTFADNATVSYDGVDGSVLSANPDTNGDGLSYISGPVVKVGDDSFVFPTGDGARFARIAVTDLANSAAATITVNDQLRAEYFFARQASAGLIPNDGLAKVSVLEFWDLQQIVGAAEPKVTLFYDETSEVEEIADLRVAHFTGGAWMNEGGVGTAVPAGSITSTNNLTSFSPITLGSTSDTSNPLPVELVSFNGAATAEEISLTWSTASELNNDYFDLQHSIDGRQFSSIGFVKGNGTTNEVIDYQLVHQRPVVGMNFYRLRQVDFDGTQEYSEIINVQFNGEPAALSYEVYPNPVVRDENSVVTISIAASENLGLVSISMIDLNGRVMQEEWVQPSLDSNHKMKIPANLSAGIYLIQIQVGELLKREKIIIR